MTNRSTRSLTKTDVDYAVTPCSTKGCVYREGHDLDVFPHRIVTRDPDVEAARAGGDLSEAAALVAQSTTRAQFAWEYGLGDGEGQVFCCGKDLDCDVIGTAAEMQRHYETNHQEVSHG